MKNQYTKEQYLKDLRQIAEVKDKELQKAFARVIQKIWDMERWQDKWEDAWP